MNGEVKGKGAVREYTVLSQGVGGLWAEVGVAAASSSRAAILAVATTAPGEDLVGTFVAVPARSWRPLTRKVETVTKASWS